MFKQEHIVAIILLMVAVALLVTDRAIRHPMYAEGFTSWNTGVQDGFCGVDLPPCPFGTRCINAYCRKENTLPLLATSGLPVLPVGYMK